MATLSQRFRKIAPRKAIVKAAAYQLPLSARGGGVAPAGNKVMAGSPAAAAPAAAAPAPAPAGGGGASGPLDVGTTTAYNGLSAERTNEDPFAWMTGLSEQERVDRMWAGYAGARWPAGSWGGPGRFLEGYAPGGYGGAGSAGGGEATADDRGSYLIGNRVARPGQLY